MQLEISERILAHAEKMVKILEAKVLDAYLPLPAPLTTGPRRAHATMKSLVL